MDNNTVPVTVFIAWSGADCIDLGEPDAANGGMSIAHTVDCHPAGADTISYQSAPGQYFGVRLASRVDVGLACEVQIGGRIIIKQNAFAFVDCMGRW
ncbi:hypothetical protein H7J86_24165 [Mycobacterium hackensackense]|uniref:hypothetical protein n=1 Tax=Mycobacterium hackensackense TaxID=228909 RepID=UPI002265ED80|nr:hypothetical protein [Mycobacterium hackensackense]MCV7255262.1 hypothetical protein [Mycobacterium hackensackense]